MFIKVLIFTLLATTALAHPGILEHSHATSYSNSNLGYGGHHALSSINLGSSLGSSHSSNLGSLGNSLNSGWWKGQKEQVVDYHAPAHYSFKYGVEDHKTGDIKEQHESREGDVVKGEYSLHEPDGTIRTVKYIADKHGGFQATVIRHGHSIHPQVISHHGRGW